MGTVESVAVVAQLLGLAISLLMRAQQVSGMIQAAQAEGRDLTQTEMDEIKATRDMARAAALAAIQ